MSDFVSAFHVACNAYEEIINGTASTTSTSMSSTSTQAPTPTTVGSTGGDNKTPVGAIVGGGKCIYYRFFTQLILILLVPSCRWSSWLSTHFRGDLVALYSTPAVK